MQGGREEHGQRAHHKDVVEVAAQLRLRPEPFVFVEHRTRAAGCTNRTVAPGRCRSRSTPRDYAPARSRTTRCVIRSPRIAATVDLPNRRNTSHDPAGSASARRNRTAYPQRRSGLSQPDIRNPIFSSRLHRARPGLGDEGIPSRTRDRVASTHRRDSSASRTRPRHRVERVLGLQRRWPSRDRAHPVGQENATRRQRSRELPSPGVLDRPADEQLARPRRTRLAVRGNRGSVDTDPIRFTLHESPYGFYVERFDTATPRHADLLSHPAP